QLPLLHVVAFFDQQMSDLAEGIGADVDVRLRPDLAGRAHHRGQILPLHFAGLYRDNVLAALVDRDADDDDQQGHHAHGDCNFLPCFHVSLSGAHREFGWRTHMQRYDSAGRKVPIPNGESEPWEFPKRSVGAVPGPQITLTGNYSLPASVPEIFARGSGQLGEAFDASNLRGCFRPSIHSFYVT